MKDESNETKNLRKMHISAIKPNAIRRHRISERTAATGGLKSKTGRRLQFPNRRDYDFSKFQLCP